MWRRKRRRKGRWIYSFKLFLSCPPPFPFPCLFLLHPFFLLPYQLFYQFSSPFLLSLLFPFHFVFFLSVCLASSHFLLFLSFHFLHFPFSCLFLLLPLFLLLYLPFSIYSSPLFLFFALYSSIPQWFRDGGGWMFPWSKVRSLATPRRGTTVMSQGGKLDALGGIGKRV